MIAFPEKAMVLAAGLGNRMGQLTQTTPKPLISVAGRALIDHCLDGLAADGVREAVVNVHHLADKVEAHLAERSSPAIVLSDERRQLMDTGGGIAKALRHFGDQPFFIRNSDSFWLDGVRSNLHRMAEAFRPETMDAVMLLAATVDSAGYQGRGDFLLDKQGFLVRRPERTVAPFVYASALLVHPRLFADIPSGPFSLNLLFDRAIAENRMLGVRLDGLWINVDMPAAISSADEALGGRSV